MAEFSDDLVSLYGNRPCITDLVYMGLPAELRAWVRENCERPTNPLADVWLLPVGEGGDG